MKKLAFILLLPIMLVACNSDTKHSADYQDKKASLQDQEKSNPGSFLKIKAEAHKNIIGQWVIEGSISNTAALATYKDILVKLTFVDEDGKTLSKENQAIDGDVKAGSSLDFKLKRPNVKDARNVNVTLVSAD